MKDDIWWETNVDHFSDQQVDKHILLYLYVIINDRSIRTVQNWVGSINISYTKFHL